METAQKVLITGVTGYIGSWVAYKALETGKYQVGGTVRDIANNTKIDSLKDAFGDKFEHLTLVEADLTDAESIQNAIEGYDYVIHVASPFVIEAPKDENELIVPAVEGTKAVLNACKKHKVKRVVITSSCAAIEAFDQGDIELDESYFCQPTKYTSAYSKSKILAEAAVWEFNEQQQEEDHKVEIVVLNPGFVLGPLLINAKGASSQLIINFMEGTAPALPEWYTMCVDVRDVADAHIKGLTCKPYERYVLTEGNYGFDDLYNVLLEEFKDANVNIKYSKAPKFLLWTLSWFMSEVATAYERLGVKVNVSNKKAREELEIKFTDMNTSLRDMGNSLIKFGLVKQNK